MKEQEDSVNDNGMALSEAEIKLHQQLRNNPLMGERLTRIMDRFVCEVDQGLDANQAEMMAIEEVQKLGQTMLKQWADKTKHVATDQAKNDDPGLNGNGKKNSSGIPPSESSL